MTTFKYNKDQKYISSNLRAMVATSMYNFGNTGRRERLRENV